MQECNVLDDGTATGAGVQCGDQGAVDILGLPGGDIMHCVSLCEAKITRTAVLLEEILVSHRRERHLPIRSILSVPAAAK